MNTTQPRPQELWSKQARTQADKDAEIVLDVLDRLDMSTYAWDGTTRWEAAQQIVRALNTGITDGR